MLDPSGQDQSRAAGKIADGGTTMPDGGQWITAALASGTENQKLGLAALHCLGEFVNAFSAKRRSRKKPDWRVICNGRLIGTSWGYPADQQCPRTEVSGDGRVRGDETGGGGEGLSFGTDELRIGSEIGKSIGLGMNFGGGIESGLELGERPAADEDIEGAAAEMTRFPEVWEQGLGNDEVASLGVKMPGEVRGELLLSTEEEFLPDGTLSG